MGKVTRIAFVSVLVRLGPVLVAALLGGGCGADVASHDEAKTAAAAWTTQHADGWSVDVPSAAAPAFAHGPAAAACTNGLFWLQAATAQGGLSLFFDCPTSAAVDLEWLRAHLRSYDVGFPVVDVGAPGWKFTLVPESTNLTAGLTFQAWANGVVSLRIETPVHELGGTSTSSRCTELRGTDAPLPDDCLVDLPYTGPFVYTLTTALDPKVFRQVDLRR